MGYVYYHDADDADDGTVKVDQVNQPELFAGFKEKFNALTFSTERGYAKVCGLTPFSGKSPFSKKIGEDCMTVAKKELMEFLNSLQLAGTVTQE